ncbi:hypothetical protein JQC67_14095 [Aurantibacter crassamenti]|uniref:hypothetical protein n=1 Tax=Aurantibacter crassamenti TaxID=1837375 RepID=UPI00193A8338|nr:hypothetical protein [Aurantibacter crassamenti]MBM1107282.1 hypothetical protein [Aurantibacter crassamenti]
MALAKKILRTPLRILIALFLIGVLFQVLHWQYASEILLIAFVGIGTLYTVRFYTKSEKRFVDYVKLTLIVFWSANGILRIMEFPYTVVFQVIIAVSFLTWFFLEGTAYFLDEDRRARNSLTQIIWNCAMVAGTLAIIAGSLLHILQWQFAIPLLIMGILIVAAYILKDAFSVSNIENEEGNNGEYQL